MTTRRTKRSPPADRLLDEAVAPRCQIFRQEGEYWTIVYEGTLFRLRDGKGLQYIAQLLRHPDERIHCGDLWSAAATHASAAGASAERTRVAVTKRIKASVAKIATLHPMLAEHLSARVKTGFFCTYVCDPRGPIAWTF